ncbi:Cytochrome P450 6j1 [Cryptotermes secundus]|uniref:Cytochrome P450 6j1 n=1 Tax=Cryptotermes secundus TaxID=105785 RepID=A0A2J7Q3M6_9NEOP|nr:cytochrome P450 6j1 [Cryptotermes secundus]PNF23159.1 Cytochrome P450 6j1 [Cryptotermes secundus]
MDIVTLLSILFSAASVLFGALYLYLNMAFSYWKNKNIPYLKPTFPFGNLRDLLMREKSMGGAYADIYEKLNGMEFGGVFLGHRPVFIIKGPDMIKNCLLKNFENFHDHGFVFDKKSDPLTGNLFMLDGNKWKNLRSVLSPTFTSGKIKNMFPILVECGQGLKDFFDERAKSKNVVEMKDIVARFTTDVIASCAFGIQCNCLKDPNAEFRQWGRRIVEPSFMDKIVGMLYLLVPSIPIFLKLPLTPRNVCDFFRKVVKETIEFRAKNKVERYDFMQLLIDLMEQKPRHEENEPGLTMDEVTAQVIVFFTGGFETTSTTMSFCLYELAKNKDIQVRLRSEMDAVLSQHCGNITYEAVKEMKYLDTVISETLRKYPPVTFLTRKCNKDWRISGTDLVLEKGVQVVIPVLGLHQDPEYFPDPEKFLPERFSEENKSQRPNYVYLPFGEGPRICIGMRFALIQVKVGLISLLSEYEFQPCEETSDPLTIDPTKFIMTPLEGVWLRVSRRSTA